MPSFEFEGPVLNAWDWRSYGLQRKSCPATLLYVSNSEPRLWDVVAFGSINASDASLAGLVLMKIKRENPVQH